MNFGRFEEWVYCDFERCLGETRTPIVKEECMLKDIEKWRKLCHTTIHIGGIVSGWWLRRDISLLYQLLSVTVTFSWFIGIIVCKSDTRLILALRPGTHKEGKCTCVWCVSYSPITVYHKDTYCLSAACQMDLPIGQRRKFTVPLRLTFLIPDVFLQPSLTDPKATKCVNYEWRFHFNSCFCEESLSVYTLVAIPLQLQCCRNWCDWLIRKCIIYNSVNALRSA